MELYFQHNETISKWFVQSLAITALTDPNKLIGRSFHCRVFLRGASQAGRAETGSGTHPAGRGLINEHPFDRIYVR